MQISREFVRAFEINDFVDNFNKGNIMQILRVDGCATEKPKAF